MDQATAVLQQEIIALQAQVERLEQQVIDYQHLEKNYSGWQPFPSKIPKW